MRMLKQNTATLLAISSLFGICLATFPFTHPVINPEFIDGLNEFTNYSVEHWMPQPVDHFDHNNNKTWYQRYYLSTQYYKPGGPVLLLINGESEAVPGWLYAGPISQVYAKRYSAMVVVLEHRYYGKSMPTADLSTESLHYLSSQQALADSAQFVKELTKQMSLETSKWIAFGGSYPGSLAARFRSKYPDLVAGAIASSAPMEAFFNFTQYYVTVAEILGSECSEQIGQATYQLDEELKTSTGVDRISKMFKLCRTVSYPQLNVNNPKDMAQLFGTLLGNIQTAVVFVDLYNTLPKPKTICQIMSNTSDGTALDRYAKVAALFTKTCISTDYEAYIKYAKTHNNDFQRMQMRPWIYQCCNEWSFPNTEAKNQPFGHRNSLEIALNRCKEIYDPKFTLDYIEKSVEYSNQYYGTRDTINVTNVVFVNNMLDPTKAQSILHPINNKTFVVNIEGTGHGADMIALKPNAPDQLVKAQQFIADKIGLFLHN